MKENEISNRVILLIKKISENDKLTITEGTQFTDLENWDSLNTVDLEMDIETAFNVEFNAGEFQNYRSVGTLLAAIENKIENV